MLKFGNQFCTHSVSDPRKSGLSNPVDLLLSVLLLNFDDS